MVCCRFKRYCRDVRHCFSTVDALVGVGLPLVEVDVESSVVEPVGSCQPCYRTADYRDCRRLAHRLLPDRVCRRRGGSRSGLGISAPTHAVLLVTRLAVSSILSFDSRDDWDTDLSRGVVFIDLDRIAIRRRTAAIDHVEVQTSERSVDTFDTRCRTDQASRVLLCALTMRTSR